MSMPNKAPYNPKVTLPKPRKFKTAKGGKAKKLKGMKAMMARVHKEELNKDGKM